MFYGVRAQTGAMQWDMNIGIQCLTYAAMRKTILKWCVFFTYSFNLHFILSHHLGLIYQSSHDNR
jgi:hypothetical protein